MNEKVFNGQTVLAESLLLDSLTIADGAVLTAPAGKCLTLTVDGVTRELEPGTYTGNVALTVSDAVQVDYENHGRVDHFEMANAVVISNGKYLPEKSVSAAVCAGTVSDTSVDGLTIDSRSDNFGGVYVDGDSVVTINDATMLQKYLAEIRVSEGTVVINYFYDDEGVQKKLVGIALADDDKAIPRHGYTVEADGQVIGEVTTGYRTIMTDKSVCVALVDAKYKELGTKVQRKRCRMASKIS